MSKYRVYTPADKWVYPKMKGYKMACCDCGLVHKIDFEVYKEPVEPYTEDEIEPEPGYVVRMEVHRDRRSTAAKRREDKKRQEKGPS